MHRAPREEIIFEALTLTKQEAIMPTYRNKHGINEVLTDSGWVPEATLERTEKTGSPTSRGYHEKRCRHCGRDVVSRCGSDEAAAFCGNN